MNLNFFATDGDLLKLVEWLIQSEQFRLFEGASPIDKPIREVKTAADFAAIRATEKGGLLLRGWSPAFTNVPDFRRINLNPSVGNHRTVLEGVGVIQIQGGRLVDGNLYCACISHWNEAGARSAYGDVGEVDWAALRRASGRIRREVKAKTRALMGIVPVLPDAFELLERDEITLWNFGTSITSRAAEIQRLERAPTTRRS